jgi:hypothetical protein
MSNAFIYRMPAGIAGDVTRLEHATIEPQQFDTSYPVLLFGVPVKMTSGKIRPIAAADTIATDVYGILVRPYPSQMTASEALGAGTPDTSKIANVLRRGYMTVKCQLGTPAKNGIVYVRKTAHSTLPLIYPIGGIEAAADSAKCEAMSGAYFVGTADADGNVEISYNI